jgi:ketosteroid isomerase-like protein
LRDREAHRATRRLRGPRVQQVTRRRPLARVRAIYAAFARGDVDTVLAALSPDVVWSNAGPPDIDYFGVRHGRERVAEVFAILGAEFDIADGLVARPQDIQDSATIAAAMRPEVGARTD